MQEETQKTIAGALRGLLPGETYTVPLSQDNTLRAAASRYMLYTPEVKITCNLDRATRTVTATRIK